MPILHIGVVMKEKPDGGEAPYLLRCRLLESVTRRRCIVRLLRRCSAVSRRRVLVRASCEPRPPPPTPIDMLPPPEAPRHRAWSGPASAPRSPLGAAAVSGLEVPASCGGGRGQAGGLEGLKIALPAPESRSAASGFGERELSPPNWNPPVSARLVLGRSSAWPPAALERGVPASLQAAVAAVGLSGLRGESQLAWAGPSSPLPRALRPPKRPSSFPKKLRRPGLLPRAGLSQRSGLLAWGCRGRGEAAAAAEGLAGCKRRLGERCSAPENLSWRRVQDPCTCCADLTSSGLSSVRAELAGRPQGWAVLC